MFTTLDGWLPVRRSFVAFSLLACVACGGSDGGRGGSGGVPVPSFSFFVTSVGSGDAGGNFGGLVGADQVCQNLAAAVGAGDRTWRAYLSTSSEDARDRIGTGPWYNVRLQLVAEDVASLHRDGIVRVEWNDADPDQLGTLVDENGDQVPLGEHDIVTGSEMDGTVFAGRTCLDWTSDSDNETAQIGHSDLAPPGVTIGGPDRLSWNSAHETTGCTTAGLAQLFGAGRWFCFATN